MTARLPGIKQGTSFSVYLDYSLGGAAEVFPVSNLSAQVRRANNEFLCQLAIVADPAALPGRFVASATPAQTAGWPVGDVFFDVKRNQNGTTTVTDTVTFTVSRRVTT